MSCKTPPELCSKLEELMKMGRRVRKSYIKVELGAAIARYKTGQTMHFVIIKALCTLVNVWNIYYII